MMRAGAKAALALIWISALPLSASCMAEVDRQAAQCSQYLTTAGQQGQSCHWAFALKSPEAATLADAIWSTVTECSAGKKLGPDLGVNHPDSYALRQWQTEHGTYLVSVKDKGGLGQTLTFLRFEPTP